MVGGLSDWQGCPEHIARYRRDGGRTINSRLSLFALDAEGSDRGSDLRPGRCEDQEARPPVRSDDGRSADGAPRADRERTDHSDGGRLRAGYDGNGRDSVGDEANSLSPLKSLNAAQLPHVQDGHWRQALKTASEDAKARLRDGAGFLDAPAALEANTHKALETTFELMHADHTEYDEESSLVFNRINKVRLAAASTVLNTQVRVNDLQLKKVAQEDTLKLVLQRMREEQARLASEAA